MSRVGDTRYALLTEVERFGRYNSTFHQIEVDRALREHEQALLDEGTRSTECPEPPVEGALEAARERFVQQLGYWLSKDTIAGVVNFHVLTRDLDAIIALAAARSGHDGLRIAELEEALRFYADHRMPDREVNVSVATGVPHSFKYIDHGNVARRALSSEA
ncbi:hypothetical protein LCGC14_0834740 [marine sediment metagenome]|uniref:Uncharacterized protein n=1 Tax=marine sediment metagenome TaxID=412755 RepID=A0A0F9RZM7_9ZZZZ